MQFNLQRAFPYPVLRPGVDDYIDGDFQVTVDFVPTEDSMRVECTFQLSVDEIRDQIDEQKARFVSVIACRDTFFRYVCSSHQPTSHDLLPLGSLRGEVIISSYVIADAPISSFNSDLINKEFGAGPFSYPAGGVLALDEPKAIFIERDNFRPISSVFELVCRPGLSRYEWRLNLESEKVQIVVSEDAKRRIDIARNDKAKQVVLINSLYFAAIMQIASTLKGSEDYNEYRWAKVFMQQAHNLGIDLDKIDEYIVAQKLLRSPMMLLEKYILCGDDQ